MSTQQSMEKNREVLTRRVNQYLQDHVKEFLSFNDLAGEIIHKRGQRNGKHTLKLLRQLTLFIALNQPLDRPLIDALLSMVEDNSSHDIDRKVVRSSYFLLTEMLLNAPRSEDVENIASNLVETLLSEIKKSSDSRLCMSWRLVSRVAYTFDRVKAFDDSLYTLFRHLKYPEKEKRWFVGKTKDFENQLHFWTALFSSMRRARLIPPVDGVSILFTGCKSSHTQLSRHAFYLLKFAIEKHPTELQSHFHLALKDSDFLSRASADIYSCIYLMEACKAFIVSTNLQDAIVNTLNYLFMLLTDVSVKIRVECIRILTEIPRGGVFVDALSTMGGESFLQRMIMAIQPSLENMVVPATDEEGFLAGRECASGKRSIQPIGFGNVDIGPLCRACIRLGRYVMMYPEALKSADDAQSHESDKVFKLLAKELVRLMKEFRKSSVFLSHAYCDTLKALLWLLPDPTENNALGMYDWFLNNAIAALPTLQESLTETVMRHIFGRIEESPRSSDVLLNIALKCAEKSVACFNNTSGQAVGILIQVWEQFAMRKQNTTIQESFFRSLVSAADGSLWQHRSAPSSPEHGLFGLRLHALWALGEYAEIWDCVHRSRSPASQDPSDVTMKGVFYSIPPAALRPEDEALPPLLQAASHLFHVLQTEPPSLRSVALESLFKIAMYCPAGSALREVIQQEMLSIGADTFGVQTASSLSGGYVDPRCHRSMLEKMKLTCALNCSEPQSSLCHSGARLLRSSQASQSSLSCQDALLYYLALKNEKPPADPSPSGLSTSIVQPSVEEASSNNSTEVDLLGDLVSPPQTQEVDLLSASENVDDVTILNNAGSSAEFRLERPVLEDLYAQLNISSMFD